MASQAQCQKCLAFIELPLFLRVDNLEYNHLDKHKRAVHEGVMYPRRQCDHKATSKGHLAQHKRAVHEGVKYPCRQYDHKG